MCVSKHRLVKNTIHDFFNNNFVTKLYFNMLYAHYFVYYIYQKTINRAKPIMCLNKNLKNSRLIAIMYVGI